MATMVKLTTADGSNRDVWVNADTIAYVEARPERGNPRIVFTGIAWADTGVAFQDIRVTQSPDEVAQAIRGAGRP